MRLDVQNIYFNGELKEQHKNINGSNFDLNFEGLEGRI